MIKVYARQGCNSTKRALEWFHRYQLGVEVYRLNHITREDLIEVLSKSSRGIDGLIKSSSRVSSKQKRKIKELEGMNFNEGIDYLIDNLNLLQNPIIMGEKLSLIGYNSEEIRHFLPKEYRRTNSLSKKEKNI